MGALMKLEDRLERLVGGAFAKVFRAEIQPVEIVSALRRECDSRAVTDRSGLTTAPNDFRVGLGPQDHDRLAVFAVELTEHLASAVRAYAEEQRYGFAGPLAVHLERADDLGLGMLRVHARSTGPVRPAVRLEIGGRTVPLAAGEVVLGRGDEADVRIDDPGVSRRHARLLIGPSASVVDLGSTNGMLVDGRRTTRADLRDGSTIVLGSTPVVYRSSPDGP